MELTLDDGRGLWLRHTVHRGRDPHVGVWAVLFDREGCSRGWHHAGSLDRLQGGRDPWFATPQARLTPRTAHGTLDGPHGPLTWDLTLGHRGVTHRHVPRILTTLGLGRTYEPAILDLRASGHVQIDGDTVLIRDARGVCGHIFGARNRLQRWSWCHGGGLGHEGVTFELLSAQLSLPGLALPPLTSVVLHTPEATWRWSSLRDLVRTRAHFAGSRFSCVSRRGAVELQAHLQVPERAALAAYQDPDGARTWCRNSTRVELQVHLRQPGAAHRSWSTDRALGELGTRTRPPGPVTVPPEVP